MELDGFCHPWFSGMFFVVRLSKKRRIREKRRKKVNYSRDDKEDNKKIL